jgi:hypothetical protein
LDIAVRAFAPDSGDAVLPPNTCCHLRETPAVGPREAAVPVSEVAGDERLAAGEVAVDADVVARWCEVVVAVVATGAAGVKDSLFKSGSSSDLRRRGDPPRPDGEVGLDD